MIESILDFQFELLTTYYTTRQQPQRSKVANGQPLLSAPYGIYDTSDGHIAIAMMDIHTLADTIGCSELKDFSKEEAFSRRDEIKTVLAAHLLKQTTDYWLGLMQDAGLWSMHVLNWEEMTNEEAYQSLGMEQVIKVGEKEITTTRCPIRINGKRLVSGRKAPGAGEHNELIKVELL